MIDNEALKKEIKELISESQENFPFISNFWNIDILVEHNERKFDFNYGHFQTVDDRHVPFYKSYSRMIDFNKLNEK